MRNLHQWGSRQRAQKVIPMPTPNQPSPEVKLLPCPFCGNCAFLEYQLHDLGDYIVLCDSCGASTCPKEMRYDKDEAIIDWNTRVNTHAELVEALRGAVEILEMEFDYRPDDSSGWDEIKQALARSTAKEVEG
jgi:Lar family restriction alleviation protein